MGRVLVGVAAFFALVAPATAQEITVYSSLPLQGAARAQTTAIVSGAQLALNHASGLAAGRPVRFVSLDDSSGRVGSWMPELEYRNARRAADDRTAVAYIGAFNSGASAISIPILNEAGILQVSPSNTAPGLTRRGPGADTGEPDKYYPTGTRTYGRIIPADHVQARAAAVAAKQDGVTKLLVVHDGEVYGRGIARGAAAAARRAGIRVVATRRLSARGRNAAAIARAARRADGVVYGGITASGAHRLFNAAARAKRTLRLYGSDGVAEASFVRRLSPAAAARTKVLVATLSPESYGPAAQPVLQQLGPNPDPYALYGYEAMAVILDAINRAGSADREAIVRAFFATRDRDSVLGRYSIDRFGDTTLTTYGLYAVRGGVLQFERALDARP